MSDEYAQYGAPHPVYLNVPGNGMPRIWVDSGTVGANASNVQLVGNQSFGHILSFWMDVKAQAAAGAAGQNSVILTAVGSSSGTRWDFARMGLAYQTTAGIVSEGGPVIPPGYVIPLCTPGGLLPTDTTCSFLMSNGCPLPVGVTVTIVYTTT